MAPTALFVAIRMLSSIRMLTIDFPSVQVKDGCRLIQSPEKWAAGAGVMLGVGRFDLRDVRGPTCYGNECCVQFDAVGKRFRLIGEQQNMCKLTVTDTDQPTPHATFVAKVLPLMHGMRLVVHNEGEDDNRLEAYAAALRAGLWPCVQQTTDAVELEPFVHYRRKLGMQ